MTVVLPAPLGPTSAIRLPGIEAEIETAQRRLLAGRVAGRNPLQGDGAAIAQG